MAHRVLAACTLSALLLPASWAQDGAQEEAAAASDEASATPMNFDAVTPELFVAHPSRVIGDPVAWRAALSAALKNDPQSPLAPLVYDVLSTHRSGNRSAADLALEGDLLREHLADVGQGPGSLELRMGIHANARARRYGAAPVTLDGDLYPEFVSRWHVVGPLGALDERAPTTAPAPDLSALFEGEALARFSPEPGAAEPGKPRFSASYLAADGVERPWTPAVRYPNQLSARWRRSVFPADGVTYALAFVRTAGSEDPVTLEIRTDKAIRAWWNDALAIEETRATPLDGATVLRALVTPTSDGWNALLLRVPTQDGSPFSVRFLDAGGHALEVQQPDEGSSPLQEWVAPEAADSPKPMRSLLDELRAAVPNGPFAAALRMYIANRGRRFDVALAEPRPGSDATHEETLAWLQERLVALRGARHLPDELKRRESIKVIEELNESGSVSSIAHAFEIQRLLQENKPVEALELADAWREALPDYPEPALWRLRALNAIDRTGTMGQSALEEVTAAFPHYARGRTMLAERLVNRGASPLATEHAWAALTTDANQEEALDFLVEVFAQTGDPRLDTLRLATEAWDAQHPAAVHGSGALTQILAAQGKDAEILELEAAFAAANPMAPSAWWALAERRLAAGDETGAADALRRELTLRPHDETSRELLTRLGGEDPAEAFFAEFSPDTGAALALAKEKETASVVEALDSGLVYMYPDGSVHARYQTLTVPMDRSGAEELNAVPVREGTRRIRILKENGDIQEPVDVNGEWVLPALAVGDVIDTVWDTVDQGVAGAPPEGQLWRFASFERAFPTSRWVLFVPDGLPGDLRLLHYEGSHETLSWGGGTVHVLAASNPQFIAEPLQPTEIELLPVATYGADRDRADELRSWWRYGMRHQSIPADLEPELAQFIEESLDGLAADDTRGRAKALYEAVDEYLQSFEGDEDAPSVWLTEKGWPVFLLSALYQRAGIPFEWAVLKSRVSPELESPSPLVFDGVMSLAQLVLRLGIEDEAGDPIWIIHSGARGTPFGAIVDGQVGASAYVMESSRGDAREETLPRTQAGEFWNLDLSLTYTLQPDGSASVTGRMSDPSPQGQTLIKRVREATAEQRDGFAKSQAANFTPGVDLAEARVVLDGSEGPGMQLLFSGTAVRFANQRDGGFAAAIPFVPLQLDKSFGPAERRWPIAMRSAARVRATIRIEPGEGWSLEPAAPAALEERTGFSVGLDVTDDPSGARVYRQQFEQRGLLLQPEEVPAFLVRMGEIEQEFRRPLMLRKN